MDKWDPEHAAWLSRGRRSAVELDATVIRGGVEEASRVTDVSGDGCCLTGFFRIGEHLTVRIDDLGEFGAQVRWALAGKAGIRFVTSRNTGPAPRMSQDARGAAAIEYALLAALIALAIVAALTGTGANVENSFNEVDAAMPGGVEFHTT